MLSSVALVINFQLSSAIHGPLLIRQGHHRTMDTLPTWAWWIIAAGSLLSPVFAFLLALLVEIFVGVLKEGGVPALLTLVGVGVIGRLVVRKRRVRARARTLVGDHA